MHHCLVCFPGSLCCVVTKAMCAFNFSVPFAFEIKLTGGNNHTCEIIVVVTSGQPIFSFSNLYYIGTAVPTRCLPRFYLTLLRFYLNIVLLHVSISLTIGTTTTPCFTKV